MDHNPNSHFAIIIFIEDSLKDGPHTLINDRKIIRKANLIQTIDK